jgi:hypothetical protein
LNQTPAELRNAAARQLIARGRWRQALDLLNEAVRLDPRLPDSYLNRAEVFEHLGMMPQADADRRKFASLGGVIRPAEPEAPPPPSKTKIRRRPPATIGIRYPAPPKRSHGWNALTQTGLTAFAALALLVAAGIGIFLAVNTLSDAISGDDTVEQPGGSETPAATGTPAPTDSNGNTITPAPTATIVPTPESLTDALNGSPLSFDSLQTAWAAKGLTATAVRVDDSVTGTGTTPVSVTLSKGDAVMHLAVLFYDDPSAPYQDFDLADTVTPKEGREIPGGAVGWYNRNVVVIVLDQDQTIKPDAFDAFANLS